MKAGKVVLALDGMGGDRAPEVVVNGADIARERLPDTTYLLFGDPQKLKPLVDKRKGLVRAVEIVPAADAVSADDKPSFALRRRRQSSMWLACRAAADSRADTVVSAGNAGALLAISMFAMRMLEGAHRPALGVVPADGARRRPLILDLGANLECDADNLAEFAVMGSVFARVLLGLDAPKVGLLNVGSEGTRGGIRGPTISDLQHRDRGCTPGEDAHDARVSLGVVGVLVELAEIEHFAAPSATPASHARIAGIGGQQRTCIAGRRDRVDRRRGLASGNVGDDACRPLTTIRSRAVDRPEP